MNERYNEDIDILDTILSLSSDEVFTPPKIANELLDSLPNEIWHNKTIKILDPVCKSGVFLRECAKRLFKGLEEEIPDEKERRKHIFKNMLFGIALTKLTYLFTRKTLYYSKSFSKGLLGEIGNNFDGNIFYKNIDHIYGKDEKCIKCRLRKENVNFQNNEKHAYAFIHMDVEKEIFKEMRFDVIIGNPPYQLLDGSGNEKSKGSIPLYNRFVEIAIKLNPKYISFIIPSRWFSAGKGLNSFRRTMMTSKKIKKIFYFQNSTKCFPTQKIRGGICYFLWDSEHNGLTEFIEMEENERCTKRDFSLEYDEFHCLVQNTDAIPIIRKIRKKTNVFLNTKVLSTNPFGFQSNFYLKLSKKELTFEQTLKNKIKIYYYAKNKQCIGYIEKNKVKKHFELLSKYKVFLSAARGGKQQKLPKPFLGLPNEICSATYLVIGFFDNESEAKNLISYIKTNFFQFLVSQMKITQHLSQKVFQFVPTLDYKTKWTDDLLFKKYDLNDLEIQTIVKFMDRGK